jgi:hypothetical protein
MSSNKEVINVFESQWEVKHTPCGNQFYWRRVGNELQWRPVGFALLNPDAVFSALCVTPKDINNGFNRVYPFHPDRYYVAEINEWTAATTVFRSVGVDNDGVLLIEGDSIERQPADHYIITIPSGLTIKHEGDFMAPSVCNHDFEIKPLFTGSYKICKQCKKEEYSG